MRVYESAKEKGRETHRENTGSLCIRMCVYTGAVDALSALADKLRSVSGTGPFLMGAKPCSLDALVFGHLVFYQRSPCAAEVLKTAVRAWLVYTPCTHNSCASVPSKRRAHALASLHTLVQSWVNGCMQWLRVGQPLPYRRTHGATVLRLCVLASMRTCVYVCVCILCNHSLCR